MLSVGAPSHAPGSCSFSMKVAPDGPAGSPGHPLVCAAKAAGAQPRHLTRELLSGYAALSPSLGLRGSRGCCDPVQELEWHLTLSVSMEQARAWPGKRPLDRAVCEGDVQGRGRRGLAELCGPGRWLQCSSWGLLHPRQSRHVGCVVQGHSREQGGCHRPRLPCGHAWAALM